MTVCGFLSRRKKYLQSFPIQTNYMNICMKQKHQTRFCGLLYQALLHLMRAFERSDPGAVVHFHDKSICWIRGHIMAWHQNVLSHYLIETYLSIL